MKLGIPKEIAENETRVASTPESVKKLVKKGVTVLVEKSAGVSAGFNDDDYAASGASVVSPREAFGCDVVFKVRKPAPPEIPMLQNGAVLISFIEPFNKDGTIEALAKAGVTAIGMELVPRTSRAQSMDALSSQANIAGYRAVIEAMARYGRFIPMMMTSAGSAKPAKIAVLGAGVAGLQAIATAKRMGANVEAYDVRPEVKEQILSLGAKFIDLDVKVDGSGQGGYAKELSSDAQNHLQTSLSEKLKKFDIIISTANVPGRKAPLLIPEETVRGMRAGSVIVDMAAQSGGNCALTEADKIVKKHGVTIAGITNIPALMPSDSSQFYARNLNTLLSLLIPDNQDGCALNIDFQDDIIAAATATHKGDIRCPTRC